MVVIQAALVTAAWAWKGGVLGGVLIVIFLAADVLGSIPLRPRRWPAKGSDREHNPPDPDPSGPYDPSNHPPKRNPL
jgi:hypothetical protein